MHVFHIIFVLYIQSQPYMKQWLPKYNICLHDKEEKTGFQFHSQIILNIKEMPL